MHVNNLFLCKQSNYPHTCFFICLLKHLFVRHIPVNSVGFNIRMGSEYINVLHAPFHACPPPPFPFSPICIQKDFKSKRRNKEKIKFDLQLCVYVFVFVCVWVYVCVDTYNLTPAHTSAHTCTRLRVHARTHAHTNTHVRTCTLTHTHTWWDFGPPWQMWYEYL